MCVSSSHSPESAAKYFRSYVKITDMQVQVTLEWIKLLFQYSVKYGYLTFVSLISGINKKEQVRGFYRVRAVDYWNRPGPFSLSVQYPGNSPCV
jgi:hypothetical protein